MATTLTWIQPKDELDSYVLEDSDENLYAKFSKGDGFVTIEQDDNTYALRQIGKLRTVIEIASISGHEPVVLGTYKAGFGQSGSFTTSASSYKWKSIGKKSWSWFDGETELINIELFFDKKDKNGRITILKETGNLDSQILLLVGWYLAILSTGYDTTHNTDLPHAPMGSP